MAATVLPLASALWACGDSTNEDMTPPPPPTPAAMADAGMMPPGPMCPPTGDEGARVGKTIPNVLLEDCDGNIHQLHELCGRKASWFFVHASW